MPTQVVHRDGLYSIQKTARLLCRFVVTFAPIIRQRYPSNQPLSDALDAALAACQVLEAQVTAQKAQGV